MGVLFKELTQPVGEQVKNDVVTRFTAPLYAGHEFIALLNKEGIFYYLCDENVDMDLYEEHTGFCIIERSNAFSGYIAGRGLYHTEPVYGIVTNAIAERELPAMEKALTSFIPYDKDRKWYSLDSDLNHFVSGGRDCYYIHDFYPKACPENRKRFQGMINNTVYSFKSGEAASVVAKLLSMAIAKEREIIKDAKNTVLLCIPASTAEKHEKRFRVFSRKMAGYLGVGDGYGMLRIVFDREFGDVRKGMPVTENIRLTEDGDPFEGKHVLLCDDLYTSGRSFDGMADYLTAAGAVSVTGIFLAKTKSIGDRH